MAKRPRDIPLGRRADGRSLPAADFRANALAVIRQVHDTGRSVTVTTDRAIWRESRGTPGS